MRFGWLERYESRGLRTILGEIEVKFRGLLINHPGRSVEVMASGIAIIETPAQGSKEILVDGESALIYPPGDS